MYFTTKQTRYGDSRESQRAKSCTFWELGMAVRMVRSAATAFLYRRRASSRAPPAPAEAVAPSEWRLELSEAESVVAEGALGEVEVAEGEVDHRTGLQSSSFMEERIWKANSMVSSKYFCPSIANSWVVFDLDIMPFPNCSSITIPSHSFSAKTTRFRNSKTLTFYRFKNTNNDEKC